MPLNASPSKQDQYKGCLLGLSMGDALGAPFEGGPLERVLWRLIGKTSTGRSRWTDDTQMTLDLAESILDHGRIIPEKLACKFATSYRWSRGYGPSTSKILRKIRKSGAWSPTSASVMHSGGSYGNGAAMRSSVLALFFPHTREKIVDSACTSARVTHTHPLGVEGAVMISVVTQSILKKSTTENVLSSLGDYVASPEMVSRISQVDQWLRKNDNISPREVARTLGNKSSAHESCPTAIYVALKHIDLDFATMIDFVRKCGGDVDTIAAMSGSIWGVANGSSMLPKIDIEKSEFIESLALRIHQFAHGQATRRDLCGETDVRARSSL